MLSPHEQSQFKPPVNGVVIEPVKGPWKNNVRWGDGFKGPMPAAAGSVIPVFSGEEIPGPPRVQTIQLFRDDRRPGQNADFRAHVSYGVGATNNDFFCDWAQGRSSRSSPTGCASTLSRTRRTRRRPTTPPAASCRSPRCSPKERPRKEGR